MIARCSVDYEGRLSAHLPEAVRLIMVKADGCVAIHADGGAYKPLNWMNAPNTLVTGDDAWLVTNPKGERLTITMHEVVHDSLWELGVDPGLQKDGVEAHLQELLAANPHAIEDGLRSCAASTRRRSARSTSCAATATTRSWRSRSSAAARSTASSSWPATSSACTSTRRSATVRGVFVAQVVKPQARVLAEARGFRWVEVDYDELRGMAPTDLRLF